MQVGNEELTSSDPFLFIAKIFPLENWFTGGLHHFYFISQNELSLI